MHNGIIDNYEEIVARNGLHPLSECDSEVLALLVEDSPQREMLERCIDAVGYVAPGKALALAGLWRSGRVVLARRGNPIWLARTGSGTYFASLPDALPTGATEMPDDWAREYLWREEGPAKVRSLKIRTTRGRQREDLCLH